MTPTSGPPGPGVSKQPGPSRVDAMLARARERLRRLDPERAAAAAAVGAVLVDIRPAAQRAAEGEVPGALIIERNVLEWRLDPTSDARLPLATGDDVPYIIFCSEGYTSSLAAAALLDLGLHRSTDVIGGFQAWRRAGLPAVGGTGVHGHPNRTTPDLTTPDLTTAQHHTAQHTVGDGGDAFSDGSGARPG